MKFGLVLVLLIVVLLPMLLEAESKHAKSKAKITKKAACMDIAKNCNRLRNHCGLAIYRFVTKQYCRATCKLCKSNKSKKPVTGKKQKKSVNKKTSKGKKATKG